MYNLSDINTVKSLLKQNGFTFKKSLGQNFLIDPTVCPEMAEYATADGTRNVIEIGTGVGVLTSELAKTAKKVVAIELDERLRPVLDKTLAEFDNVKVIFGDVFKTDLKELIETEFSGEKVSVCANLPYYITSPIIMMLLESRLPIESLTIMVQKEAADRICAEVGSRESGAVTVAVNYYSKAEKLFDVLRDSFIPSPNVDSCVIKLSILKQPPIKVADEESFFKFVRSAFSQRRKTLVNSVSSTAGIPKDVIIKALSFAGLELNIRAERLAMKDFETVFSFVYENMSGGTKNEF